MRYIITLIACSLLFAQCTAPDIDVHPTGSYDTLGVKWMTIERDNIIYYFQGTGAKGASVYTDLHEEGYDKLVPVFNAQLPKKLRYFVWTDWEVASQIFNPPPWAAGLAFSKSCICHVQADIDLGHEITHVLSYWANGIPQETYSRLVTEGVAVAFDLRGDNKLETAKKALSGKGFQSVAEFWTDTPDSISPDVFYPVAGAFIDFLYKKNMPDQFFTLLKYQTREEAGYIYGKEQLDAYIAEFDGLVGL